MVRWEDEMEGLECVCNDVCTRCFDCLYLASPLQQTVPNPRTAAIGRSLLKSIRLD